MRVVIVDDQASARVMISGLVRAISEDIEVHEFWDADEALEWCIAHGPAIVLLDYRMPSIDGVTFAHRLKASPAGAGTAIVMVTSQDDASIRQAALEAGVVAYVRKPITASELKLQIRNLLASMHGHALAGATSVERQTLSTRPQMQALKELLDLARKSHPWMQYDVAGPGPVSAAIARKMNLSDALIDLAEQSGEFYAIGLLGVPVNILQRTEPLSLADQEAIQAASGYSYSILDHLDPEIARVLRSSHECFNGSGYPQGLTGTAIPLLSRIVSVAASFSAITSKRPYHEASTVSEAVVQLQRYSGSKYDPGCVNALVEALPSLLSIQSLPAREADCIQGGVR